MNKIKCKECVFSSVCEDCKESRTRCRYFISQEGWPFDQDPHHLRCRLEDDRKACVGMAWFFLTLIIVGGVVSFLAWAIPNPDFAHIWAAIGSFFQNVSHTIGQALEWLAISFWHIAFYGGVVVIAIVTICSIITIIRRK